MRVIDILVLVINIVLVFHIIRLDNSISDLKRLSVVHSNTTTTLVGLLNDLFVGNIKANIEEDFLVKLQAKDEQIKNQKEQIEKLQGERNE